MVGPWCIVLINVCPLVVIAPFIMHYMSKTVIDIKEPHLANVIKGLGFPLYTIGLIEKTAVRATLLVHLAPIWLTILNFIVIFEPVNKGRVL